MIFMASTSLAHPTRTVPELHHRVPQCLLRLYDRAASHPHFDGEGIELWLEFEHETMRYGVDADISRDDLAALIDASTVLVPREEHRTGHSEASDFVRWGRRGGRGTFRRYGRAWFVLLARRRWGRISASELVAAFGGLS
jgi:hypothetical protein